VRPPARQRGLVLICVADHPVASASIRRAKSLAGLAGFAITLGLGLRHDALLATACLHALAVGVAGYVVAWGASVTVWRQLLRAQVRTAVANARAKAEEAEQ
jgi:hypothetical protein